MDFKKGDFLSEDEAMLLAIEEGKKGAGFVHPNPQVGCVILDQEGRLLASGYHARFGGPHAEIEALRKLQPSELEEAQFFVTLEPCAHEGKTPSCAKTLAELPIHSVTYGLEDPNPMVSGKGASILRNAGIKVSIYPQLRAELEELCEMFLYNMRFERPFISLKVASSLDGQLGLKSGESKWITGEAAREHTHFLRAQHDALLVGHRTITADNPSLNIRHPKFPDKTNRVVILDPSGETLKNLSSLQISRCHKPEDIFVVTSNSTPKSSQSLPCAYEKGKGFDLKQMEKVLWERGIKSVFVEGGAFTISQFLSEKNFQRLYLFMGPHLLGAKGGTPWTSNFSIDKMQDRLTLEQLRVEVYDRDLLITGFLPPTAFDGRSL